MNNTVLALKKLIKYHNEACKEHNKEFLQLEEEIREENNIYKIYNKDFRIVYLSNKDLKSLLKNFIKLLKSSDFIKDFSKIENILEALKV